MTMTDNSMRRETGSPKSRQYPVDVENIWPRIEETTIQSRPALRWRTVTTVWRPRYLIIGILLIAVLISTTSAGILLGNLGLSVRETWSVLHGNHEDLFYRVIMERRMPRVLMAGVAGLALGIAGAITQAVARNALASPDILGINTGASAVTVTMIVGFSSATGIRVVDIGGEFLELIGRPLAALIGAYITASVIWFLSWKRGIETFRLVLIGMGISMLLGAYMQVLLLKANLRDLAEIMRWTNGSLMSVTWTSLILVAGGVALLLPLMGWLAVKLRVASLGKDSASALGENWSRAQAGLWLSAISLSALVVSVVGPIGFISFVAPQIAMRLTGSSIQPITVSGLVGAVLVSGADVAARTLPVVFPVGIVTAGLGAPVLLFLLIRTRRKMTV